MNLAARALAITCLIETPVVALFYPGERWRMAATALGINAVTNLALNVVLLRGANPSSHTVVLLVGEVAAMLLEALTYALVSRRQDGARALVASGLGNALSFGAGGMLAPVFFGRS